MNEGQTSYRVEVNGYQHDRCESFKSAFRRAEQLFCQYPWGVVQVKDSVGTILATLKESSKTRAIPAIN